MKYIGSVHKIYDWEKKNESPCKNLKKYTNEKIIDFFSENWKMETLNFGEKKLKKL